MAACRERPPIEPLELDGNMLNGQQPFVARLVRRGDPAEPEPHRQAGPILAGGRLQVPLDAFVAGFGQRFDYRRTQITDLRLTAKLPRRHAARADESVQVGGLEGALGGKR